MNKHWDERDQQGCAKRIRASAAPTLRFLPSAWAKLLFLRDYGDTEVGGFGITAADDLLLIEDVQDLVDNCPLFPNLDQRDDDRDFVGHACVACPTVYGLGPGGCP